MNTQLGFRVEAWVWGLGFRARFLIYREPGEYYVVAVFCCCQLCSDIVVKSHLGCMGSISTERRRVWKKEKSYDRNNTPDFRTLTRTLDLELSPFFWELSNGRNPRLRGPALVFHGRHFFHFSSLSRTERVPFPMIIASSQVGLPHAGNGNHEDLRERATLRDQITQLQA